LPLAVTAWVRGGWVWSGAGGRWGYRFLHFIHGLPIDPDAADRTSKKNFARYGPQVLVLAKFVVGLDAAAPPLAGMSGTSRLRFVAFDAVGAALWSGAYAGLGYIFSHDLDRAWEYAGRMGKLLVVVTLAGLCIYVGRKLVRWRQFLREFRLARITPEELKQRLDVGERVFVVDLQGGRRHSRDRQGIPGAVR